MCVKIDMKIDRFPENPIIYPELDESIGTNINGPSLIRAPDWLPDPMGKYYLYFAHHLGPDIRLAYADKLAGPWTIYAPGVLNVDNAHFIDHIASPDVHIDNEKREIRMFYHGMLHQVGYVQGTRVALSSNGINFKAQTPMCGPAYFRVFEYRNKCFAWTMGGHFWRALKSDGVSRFIPGSPAGFPPNPRHGGVRLKGDILQVYFSRALDTPERIYMCEVDLTPHWTQWKASEPMKILRSEMDYEGANLTIEPSEYGEIHERAHQLRDPAIFEENGETYLLYSVAGESGIAIARIFD